MAQTVLANVRPAVTDLTSARELKATCHLDSQTTRHLKQRHDKKQIREAGNKQRKRKARMK
jgi:hypothetical protein